jgi:uncharacterized protein (TIGR02594 family)
MKKIILIVSLMLAPFALANLAEARPNNENTQVSQQQVKKKPVKKKPVKKVKQTQIQQPQQVINNSVYDTSEESASQYWAKEKERQQQVASSLGLDKKQNNKKTALQVSKQCSWFTCKEETSKPVYAEAKKWEGKSAKKNRGELKNLMAAGNNNTPVDPVRIPWCAGFVNAILARSGYETSGSLMARSFLNYGVVIKEPTIGDIVITKRGSNQMAGHVGFFEGYEWFEGVKYIKVYGGNTAKSVQVGYFPVNQILGYRKPVIA